MTSSYKKSSLIMTNKDQNLKTVQQRITRSTNSVPLNLIEKQINNGINVHYKTPKVVLEDIGNSFSNKLKILQNKSKDEVVARLNINLGDAVTAKIIKGTCDIYIKKQRKRGNKNLFWERKLTGACRISKRLKNIKLKNKELANKQTNPALYTDCKKNNGIETKRDKERQTKKIFTKITSKRKSSHSSKINIKSSSPLLISSSECSKSLDLGSDDSTNPDIDKTFTEVNIDVPAMVVDDNNKISLTEEVKSSEDDCNITMAQCPDDCEILEETVHGNGSINVHEDDINILGIKDNGESEEDLICEECIESVLETEDSAETQSQLDEPPEGEVSIVNPSEKVNEDTEKSMESCAASTNVQGNIILPNNEG